MLMCAHHANEPHVHDVMRQYGARGNAGVCPVSLLASSLTEALALAVGLHQGRLGCCSFRPLRGSMDIHCERAHWQSLAAV